MFYDTFNLFKEGARAHSRHQCRVVLHSKCCAHAETRRCLWIKDLTGMWTQLIRFPCRPFSVCTKGLHFCVPIRIGWVSMKWLENYTIFDKSRNWIGLKANPISDLEYHTKAFPIRFRVLKSISLSHSVELKGNNCAHAKTVRTSAQLLSQQCIFFMMRVRVISIAEVFKRCYTTCRTCFVKESKTRLTEILAIFNSTDFHVSNCPIKMTKLHMHIKYKVGK